MRADSSNSLENVSITLSRLRIDADRSFALGFAESLARRELMLEYADVGFRHACAGSLPIRDTTAQRFGVGYSFENDEIRINALGEARE